MTEKTGAGQADKADAEDRTAQVGAENRQRDQERARDAEPKTAAAKVGQADPDDATVLIDPYPAYEDKSVEELRSEAKGRDVEINRDVEKAQLVAKLREVDPTPAYDLMPLEKLREAARGKKVGMDPDFERAQWVSELRAADTHTG